MHLHVMVRGRVQGVGFRWFVRQAARELRLTGWVRNLADGSVEVAAQGDERAVASLRAALEQGPAGALVTSVDAVSGYPPMTDQDFSILR